MATSYWLLNHYYSCNNNSLKRRATPIFKKRNGCRPLEFRGTTIGSTPLYPGLPGQGPQQNPLPGSTGTGGQKQTLYQGLPGQGGKSKPSTRVYPDREAKANPLPGSTGTGGQKQTLYRVYPDGGQSKPSTRTHPGTKARTKAPLYSLT